VALCCGVSVPRFPVEPFALVMWVVGGRWARRRVCCLLSAVCLCVWSVFSKRTSLRVCPPRPSGSGSASPPARGGWGGRGGRVDGAGQGASWQAAAARGVRRVSKGVRVRVRVHVLDQSAGKKVWGRDGRKTLDGRWTLDTGRLRLPATRAADD
jgi:hypothetical protein